MCAHAGRINAETQGGGERERERSYPRGAEKALDSRSSPAKQPTHAPEDAETVYARTRHIKRK